MDRRQRKSRDAIFHAFIGLLAEKDAAHITVGEIIDRADVGRATFYAHFETKDFLLRDLCEDLFCHIFDAVHEDGDEHRHLFCCDAPDSVFLHLFRHLKQDDNRILTLLSGRNAMLFLPYFRAGLSRLVEDRLPLFEGRRPADLPHEFWVRHIVSVFVETLHWWTDGGLRESPETITEYFLKMV